MSTFLSQEVLAGLKTAKLSALKSTSRMRVRTGERIIPILRYSEDSFTLRADDAPALRGYVDILDGARLMYRALIVASDLECDEMIFEFKLSTSVATGPALDFEQDEMAPVGYLEAL